MNVRLHSHTTHEPESSLKANHLLRKTLSTAFILLVSIALLLPDAGLTQPRAVYVEQLQCEAGPFGLRLPGRLAEVMNLGPIEHEKIVETEKWDGYTVTHKLIRFRGLTLGLVTFSNDPNRYMVRFAEITDPRWSRISPFRAGETTESVQKKLGTGANNDSGLKATYGGDSDELRFRSAAGKITTITYSCHTG